jgi:hypothetical protein
MSLILHGGTLTTPDANNSTANDQSAGPSSDQLTEGDTSAAEKAKRRPRFSRRHLARSEPPSQLQIQNDGQQDSDVTVVSSGEGHSLLQAPAAVCSPAHFAKPTNLQMLKIAIGALVTGDCRSGPQRMLQLDLDLGLGLERILQGRLRQTNSIHIWLLHLLPRLHNRRPELFYSLFRSITLFLYAYLSELFRF